MKTKKILKKAGIGALIKSTAKRAKSVVSKPKTYGDSGQYSRVSDMRKSENYRAGRGYSDAVGDSEGATKLKAKAMGVGLAGTGIGVAVTSKERNAKKVKENAEKVKANAQKVKANAEKVKANKLKAAGSYKFGKGGSTKKK
jgi:hypothetical protein